MKPRKFEKGERPFSTFRKDRPRHDEEGERPFRKPFHREGRDFGDEEQYVCSGEVADIAGTHPLDRREILRRMWRHYQDAGLVKSIGGGRPPRPRSERPAYERSERPARDRDDRPRRYEDRPPRRFEREGERGERRFDRKPSDKHPARKRAETLSKVPRRKFKETRYED